jgi:triosephosphate isomerase
MRAFRLLLGTNWKMNKTIRESVDYTRRLLGRLEGFDRSDALQVFVIPPYTAIEAVKRASEGRLWVGAQNMHWAERGAYTGEISALMLQELGVDLVELGHAERRRYFNETDADVNRKVRAALQHGLRPLVCVGEQLEDKKRGIGKETLENQVRTVFANVEAGCASHLIVAYEPFWAIGAERADVSVEYVREMQTHIRTTLEEMFGRSAAALVPVIYGGDVNLRNAAALVSESGTDGLFIGRAAWEAENFADLIHASIKAIG